MYKKTDVVHYLFSSNLQILSNVILCIVRNVFCYVTGWVHFHYIDQSGPSTSLIWSRLIGVLLPHRQEVCCSFRYFFISIFLFWLIFAPSLSFYCLLVIALGIPISPSCDVCLITNHMLGVWYRLPWPPLSCKVSHTILYFLIQASGFLQSRMSNSLWEIWPPGCLVAPCKRIQGDWGWFVGMSPLRVRVLSRLRSIARNLHYVSYNTCLNWSLPEDDMRWLLIPQRD